MKIYNVVEFGAIPDGKTCNTKAIQAAIDACGVGDQVLNPSGVNEFLCRGRRSSFGQYRP